MTQARSLSLVALAIAVAIVVIHARVVLGGQTFDDVRYHTEIIPPRLAAAEAVRAGDLPGWWDGSGFGVPLLAEPSHGALAPLGWLAASSHAQDLLFILYLAWAALGVAIWARTRPPPARTSPSDQAALVVGLLVVTSGVIASAGLRGALPGIAHLPWIGAVAARLASAAADASGRAAVLEEAAATMAEEAGRSIAAARKQRLQLTAALGLLLALVATSGVLAALFDGLLIALAIGGRRKSIAFVGIAIAAGLAVGALQWLPMILQLPHSAGATVHGVPFARLLELVVPGSFGSSDPQRAIASLTGTAQFPSLYLGAPLIALAAVRIPPMRVRILIGVLVVLALVAGRGGWPAWLGAPGLHIAALAIVLAANAAAGVDSLLAADRRALRAVAASILISLGALLAFAALRARHPEAAPAIERALLEGGLGLVCVAGALLIAWRGMTRAWPVALALLVLPNAGAIGSIVPTISRGVVEREPALSEAIREAPKPVRVFRPARMYDSTIDLEVAMATLDGTSGWKWGIASVRSEDPARPRDHDRAWLASAAEGGAFLDRFGVGLAMLPSTMVDSPHSQFHELARRGEWALVTLPVAPVAAVMRSWLWQREPASALELIFPPGGGTNPRGQIVLDGAGPAGAAPAQPMACNAVHWNAGAIDLLCSAVSAGYATVTSTPAPGWTVTVDDRDEAWLTADVLRRAVRVTSGTHRIAWRYTPPGFTIALVLAALGALSLIGLLVLARRTPR